MSGFEVGMRLETRKAMRERYASERAEGCDLCNRTDEHVHDQDEYDAFYNGKHYTDDYFDWGYNH